MDITRLKAWELVEKIAGKELSIKEIVEAHYSEIHNREKDLNSFITLSEETAMKRAIELDNNFETREKQALLYGIPVGIKDNISISGEKLTCGSKMLENYIAPYNASVINNLNKNGAIFLGKTNMDEFAMGGSTETSYFGPSKNPLNISLVPGGSSGGSASCVAGYEVPISLGTDTGGSVRQPASFCGIVGIKPTYGTVSRYGIIALANTLDQVSSFGRDVKDAWLMLRGSYGKDSKDMTSVETSLSEINSTYEEEINRIKGLKVAIPKEIMEIKMDDEVKIAYEKSIKMLEQAGANIIEVSMPNLKYALSVYYLVMNAEASSNLSRFDGIRFGHRTENYSNIDELLIKSRSEGFGEEVKRRIMVGIYILSSGYNSKYYNKALIARTKIIEDFNNIYKDNDVVFIPTAPTTAFKFGSNIKNPVMMYEADKFTVPVNIAGLCAISVPTKPEGFLSPGMQFIGNKFDDNNIARISYAFEGMVNGK